MAQIVRRTTEDGQTRYDVRVRIGGRVVTKTFKRRRDADAYATTLEADLLRNVVVDPRHGRLAVKVVAERWLQSNPAKRPTTLVADEHALRQYVLPALGTREIGKVSPTEIQAVVTTWSARIAPRTVRRHYGVLRAVFAYAVANDWIGRTPCRGIKLPPIETTRRQLLEPDEIATIAGAMGIEDRPIVWLGAVLGLRWSEVAGLRVGRLDLPRRTLTVAEAVTRGRHGILVSGAPKSVAGRRQLSIPEELAVLLEEHLARRRLGPEDSEAFVFADAHGGPLHYSNWRTRVWIPACEAAGCSRAGFHDLRRANATGMVAELVDVKTAQQRLGHSDVRMTLGLYAQAVAEADRRASDALAARFFGLPARGDDSVSSAAPR